jgi:hypothetical protein
MIFAKTTKLTDNFLLSAKEGVMRRRTLLLFQLFLALFADYAILYDVPDAYSVVPLLCLGCMYLLGRHPVYLEDGGPGKAVAGP